PRATGRAILSSSTVAGPARMRRAIEPEDEGEKIMSIRLTRPIAAAAAAMVMALAATAAFANGCPAGKTVAEGQGQQPGATEPVGVTDTVLTSIDLTKEKVALADHSLRMRRLVIQPGGVVPWHSHGDRPALIYIVQGEVSEF